MNLKTKIVLSILLATGIPLTLYGAVGYVYGKRQLSTFIYERLAGVNTLKRADVEKVLADAIKDVQGIKESTILQTALRSKSTSNLDQFLTQYLDKTRLDDVKLVQTNGTILAVGNKDYVVQVGTKGDTAFQGVVSSASAGVNFSTVFRDSFDLDQEEMYAASTVVDADGLILGMVVVEISLHALFQNIASVTGLSSSGETYLAANDQYSALVLTPLKYDTTAGLTRRINFDSKADSGIQAAVQGKSGQGIITNYRGGKSMAVWEAIPATNWGILTKIDVAEGLGVLDRITKFILFAFPTGAIVISMLIFFMIDRMISRPVKELGRVSEEIAGGEHHSKVDRKLIFSHDEFGAIATNLHHIQQRFDHEAGHSSEDGHQDHEQN